MSMLESVLLHASLQVVQVISVSSVISSAGASTSMSTSIFTSSGAITTEEQSTFTPTQQAWIQSLLVDMSWCDPPTSTTSTASLTAVSLSTCNKQ